MALLVIPYSFTAATLAQSSQVNADFTAVANYINGGSGAFTANGYAIMPGGLYLQWGSLSVVADGSAATAVAFSIAFPNAVFQVVGSIDNAFQTNPWMVSLQTTAITTTGFNFNAGGAPAAQSVTAKWFALGN